MLLTNGSSSIVNSQLVPVAPPQAMSPLPALQPNLGQGSMPVNLPNVGNLQGGAIGGTAAAMTGNTGGAMSAEGGISSTINDFSALPIWKQPIFFLMVALVVGYLMLRYIHWT